MNLSMQFRHLNPTPAIRRKIKSKAMRLKMLLGKQPDINWVCDVDGKEQKSMVTVKVAGKTLRARSSASNLYKTFDQVIKKLKNQLKK